MEIVELIIIMVLVFTTVFFAFSTILGWGEFMIKFKKMMGGMKGRIIAREFRSDGVVYTHTPKIKGKTIKLGRSKTYPYEINKTFVNKINLREGYFSEFAGKQIDPYDVDLKGLKLSVEEISDLLIMATAMAHMPKKMFSLDNIPWLMIPVTIGVVMFFLFGGMQM